MNRLEAVSRDRPVLFALAAILAASVFTEISFREALTPLLGPRYAEYVPGLLEQYLAALGIAGLCAAVGLRGMATFRPPEKWATAFLGWPLLVLGLLNGSELFEGTLKIAPGWVLPLVLVLLYLSTGFLEEGLFRGLVMGLFLRRWGSSRAGIRNAALLSSLLFALAHAANLVMGRYTPLAAVTQIVFALFFGVFFAALALRTGSLLPGVILHGIFDFLGNLSALAPGALPRSETLVSRTPAQALTAIALTAPLFLYGVFILKKVRPAVSVAEEAEK